MGKKGVFRENAGDIALFVAALLLGGGYYIFGFQRSASWYVAGLLLMSLLMFLKGIFGCSGPAAVVSEWIGRLSRDETVDLRQSVDRKSVV